MYAQNYFCAGCQDKQIQKLEGNIREDIFNTTDVKKGKKALDTI